MREEVERAAGLSKLTRPVPVLTILSGLYILPAAIAMRPIVDLDVWWHLRQGAWILEHMTVPFTDPFTSYGAGKTWIAYSWLYEVLLHMLYRSFGLFGIVLYTTLLGVGIAFVLHRYFSHQTGNLVVAAGLTAVAMVAMFPVLVQPRPWLFNILFITIELTALMDVRRSGQTRSLWLLPPLFLIWACINIQFVYGLFLLALATLEALLDRWPGHLEAGGGFRAKPLILALSACTLATCLTPYHVKIYIPVITAIRLTDPFLFLSELQAPSFRHPFDWLALGLLVTATFILGRRRIAAPFLVLLLAASAVLAFRARRDVWFLVITSMTVIAMAVPSWAAVPAAVGRLRLVVVASIVIAVSTWLGMTRASAFQLQQGLVTSFPTDAAAFVETRGYRGRLYNHYDWGGYLMWRLPVLDVSLDGRNPLHGDDRIWQSIRTWGGHPSWASDPELARASIVIADVNTALASLLRLDRRFALVYEDRVAAVFVQPVTSPPASTISR